MAAYYVEQVAGSQPVIIEVAGVTGAGKSTVTSTLTGADSRFVRGDFIHARKPTHLYYLVRALPRLTPLLLVNVARKPRISWADFKLLAYVTEWMHVLARRSPTPGEVLLLDQGPVYAMVRLTAKAGGITSSEAFAKWRDEMLSTWAGVLMGVIWLDAPDRLLLERVNGREQPHAIKGQTEEAGEAFLHRYRRLFEEVLNAMEASGVVLWRFDTGLSTGEMIADVLRAELAPRLDPA